MYKTIYSKMRETSFFSNTLETFTQNGQNWAIMQISAYAEYAFLTQWKSTRNK